MSVWAGIKTMLGSSETGAKIVDGAISGLDAMFHTDEEKSELAFRFAELRIKFAESTTGSRLARRYIAFAVVGTYLLWFNIAGVMVLFGTDPVQVIELLTSLAVGGSFVAIISWYFFTGVKRNN